MTFGMAAVTRLSGSLVRLDRWRRWLVAFALGALAAAAQPPVHLVPVLLISFPGLVWLLDGAGTRRAAFSVGWLFGAGYFAAGLYWVSNALLVDAARFAWLIPFTVLGLSFGLGLLTGLMTLAARLFWHPGVSRVLMLAATWTAFEFVRGVVLTGFPWNPIGNVWVAVVPVLQGAAWIGVYGLTLVTVFAAAALTALTEPGRQRVPVALSGLIIFAGIAVAGHVALESSPRITADVPVIRVVQPNIRQADKWDPQKRAANFARQLQLSTAGDGKPTYVIWPETAAAFSYLAHPATQTLLDRVIPEKGLLISGVLRVEREGSRALTAFNSLAIIGRGGPATKVYDKHHLVPFGEYAPFKSVLPIDKITAGAVDFTPGPGLRTLRLPGVPPFSPLICYEIIFPGAVVVRGDRPNWLLNITNDAWFGMSVGPHQHFASARLRAVEEGLPLVRAANTGISGIIDPRGRVVASLGLGRKGVVDALLPMPASPTFFSKHGNHVPAVLICLCLILAVIAHYVSVASKK